MVIAQRRLCHLRHTNRYEDFDPRRFDRAEFGGEDNRSPAVMRFYSVPAVWTGVATAGWE